MPTGDTIAALAGPASGGPRVLLRVSGPVTKDILHRLFAVHATADHGAEGARAMTRRAQEAELHAGFAAPIPTRVLRFAGPRSFTGEDSAELLLPANATIAERVLDLVLATPGVRLALPGEFTARAYLNDRLTLEQAEGVGALIAANTEADLAAAQSLLSGVNGAKYSAWGDRLARALALVEAGIDFSDQEAVVPITASDLRRELTVIRDEITSLIAPMAREERSTLPLVMLVGAPNAGKSTLFNALLGRHRAVVSPAAGTTRDVIVEELELIPHAGTLDAVRVKLADSAGIDEAGDTHAFTQDLGQNRTRESLSDADVLVYCDPSGRFSMPLPAGATVVRVRTKGDLPHGDGSEQLAVCALDGWNLGTLKRVIADIAGTGARGVVLPRHDRLLRHAAASIADVTELVPTTGRSLRNAELIADGLRGTLDTMAELAGRISPDDVLGRIFATFCIGK